MIAKTTTQHIWLILPKVPIQKKQKTKALTVICTILFHSLSLQISNNYNIFQQSVTQWSPLTINNILKKPKKHHTFETMGPIQSVNSSSKPNLARFSDCVDFKVFKYPSQASQDMRTIRWISLISWTTVRSTEAGGGSLQHYPTTIPFHSFIQCTGENTSGEEERQVEMSDLMNATGLHSPKHSF